METEEHRRSRQTRRHRALQGSCKWEQEELRAKNTVRAEGSLKEQGFVDFFRLFGCCVVWNYCPSSASLQHSYSADCFRNECCHHDSSFDNCPASWLSKQVAFCTKIYQKNVINLPRVELLPPDFVSRPCFGTCQWVASSKTHTPGHTEGCAFARGRVDSKQRNIGLRCDHDAPKEQFGYCPPNEWQVFVVAFNQ